MAMFARAWWILGISSTLLLAAIVKTRSVYLNF